MKAVFYDRKNKREVSSEELKATRLVKSIAIGDDDDEKVPTGRRLSKHGTPFTKEQFDDSKEKGHFKQCGYDLEPTWESFKIERTPFVLHLVDEVIADLFYRSPECPKHINGDLYTTVNDLVFLRLE